MTHSCETPDFFHDDFLHASDARIVSIDSQSIGSCDSNAISFIKIGRGLAGQIAGGKLYQILHKPTKKSLTFPIVRKLKYCSIFSFVR